MNPITVITVTENERQKALNTLLLGFASDPLTRWMCPMAHVYLDILGAYDAFAGNAIDHGYAFASEGFGGVTMWLPPGAEPDDDAMEREFQRLCGEDRVEEVFSVFEQMAGYHPEEPCWYLPMIAVDPAHQGQGIGAALMKHALRIIDERGEAAYLESSNPRNISLYQRHGFETMGEVQTGSSPVITPMYREARQ